MRLPGVPKPTFSAQTTSLPMSTDPAGNSVLAIFAQFRPPSLVAQTPCSVPAKNLGTPLVQKEAGVSWKARTWPPLSWVSPLPSASYQVTPASSERYTPPVVDP